MNSQSKRNGSRCFRLTWTLESLRNSKLIRDLITTLELEILSTISIDPTMMGLTLSSFNSWRCIKTAKWSMMLLELGKYRIFMLKTCCPNCLNSGKKPHIVAMILLFSHGTQLSLEITKKISLWFIMQKHKPATKPSGFFNSKSLSSLKKK